MKKTFVFFALLITAACFSACRQEELPRVEFDGQNYELAFSAQQPAGRINEYRLPNENLEKYSKMIAVYSFPGLKEKTPQQAPKQAKTEQADKVHDSEVEQTEVIITDVQRGCLIALERAVKRGGSYPEIYVEDALQQGVPQELINNILRERFSDGLR